MQSCSMCLERRLTCKSLIFQDIRQHYDGDVSNYLNNTRANITSVFVIHKLDATAQAQAIFLNTHLYICWYCSGAIWRLWCIKSPETVFAGQQYQSAESLVFCVGTCPVSDGVPSKRAHNMESVSMFWRHPAVCWWEGHCNILTYQPK